MVIELFQEARVEQIQFQVEFYDTEDGRTPTQEFLDSLEPKMNAKMVGLMEILVFFFYVEGRIVITHGFIKKTQKTLRAQIELAKKYRADFLRRQQAAVTSKKGSR